VLLVANKLDAVKRRTDMLPWLKSMQERHPFAEYVPMSRHARGRRAAPVRHRRAHLPEQAWLYEEDALTDRSDRFLASEIVREKLFRLTGDELPYTSTVVIDKYEEEGNLRRIGASIVVERDAHKGMVIGEGGERLKRIGSEARQELESCSTPRSSSSCGSRCARAGPTTRRTCAATATSDAARGPRARHRPPRRCPPSCCTAGTGARPA
jgi:GTP-binding protein Era